MALWKALLLGLVQGITEFLPVSSSGHLLLTQYLLDIPHLKDLILFDLVCHLGTLGTIFIFFWKEIREALSKREKVLAYAIALSPLFFLFPFLKGIKASFESPHFLGVGFLLTALILYMGKRFEKLPEPSARLYPKNLKNTNFSSSLGIKTALGIGLSQILAVFPGVSRSGMTISAGRVLGLAPEEAVCFSFILSIPTVLGALGLETYKALTALDPFPPISLGAYLTAALSSFLFGLFSLKLLIRIIRTARFQLLTWYLISIGLITLYIF